MKWLQIPDEVADQQMSSELEKCFGIDELKGKDLEEFKQIISDFITENHKVCGGGENAEIIADDYEGSYEKAITELHKELKEYFKEVK